VRHKSAVYSIFGLLFPRCPKFLGSLSEEQEATMEMHYQGKIRQRRAHASYDKDGNVEMYRDTTAWLTKDVTQEDLARECMDVADVFFFHAFIARHQARMFDACIDHLDLGSIVILIDYSMNYG